jgi:N-hydroxyarylamine O-acetyltransferase
VTFAPDLDAYLARIGYGGPRTPTLETLDGLMRAHVQRIPFESLDVILGRGIDLDPAAVERKLVHARRGGYCFEHNSHFLHVLTALGFEATPLSARVRMQRPRWFTPPRTHMFLRVMLDGRPWLADVGIGALSLTGAIRLDLDDEAQPTPHEPRRLTRDGELRFHQVRFADGWHDVYDFTGEEMPEIDRVVGNWYTSTHPTSHFRERLMVTRATDDGRLVLLNRELAVRDRHGVSRPRQLASHDELVAVLAEHFDLHFPPDTRFECAQLVW